MHGKEVLNQVIGSIVAYLPNIIAALAILLVGWLIAVIVSAAVRGLLNRTKLANKISGAMGRTGEDKEKHGTIQVIGKGLFWLIMIPVLIAFFQALRLTLVTNPLQQFMDRIFQFLPQLIGAGILLLLAWITATVSRLAITRVMGVAKLDERVGGRVDAEKSKRTPLTKTVGDIVYWLIFLLFLPAVLGALNLEGLLKPVQSMLDKFLAFLPNILAAGVIGLVGWFVARIVRQLVSTLLSATGLDNLSDQIGVTSLSKIIAMVVYILILIPVMIAVLNALALESITQPASGMLTLVLGALPAVFAAVLVITIAYLVGKVLSTFITELMTNMGFNSIFLRLGIGKAPEEGKRTPSEVAGDLVLVTIMLFAIFEASNLLGFKSLSTLMTELVVFGGHILLGLIIIAIGLYLANVASKTIQASGTVQASLMSTVARVAILLLAGAIAIRYMGLANEIINLAFGLILGAIAVAVAIAFGIGGRDIAARKLEEWSKSKKDE